MEIIRIQNKATVTGLEGIRENILTGKFPRPQSLTDSNEILQAGYNFITDIDDLHNTGKDDRITELMHDRYEAVISFLAMVEDDQDIMDEYMNH